MTSATLAELKRELSTLDSPKLREVALRMAKYKVENKELLTYLLYESSDEAGFVEGGKRGVDEAFAAIPNKNLYYYKKSLRKILRMVNKQAKYSGIPSTGLELRIHFCLALKNSGVDFRKSPVIVNLYQQQVRKIQAILKTLPDDLQADYSQSVNQL
jgi:hypothetical protein